MSTMPPGHSGRSAPPPPPTTTGPPPDPPGIAPPAHHGAPPAPWVPSRLDPVSVAGFVCGVLPLIPLGLVLGVVGIVRTRRRELEGRFLAIFGVLLSLAWVAFLVSMFVYGGTLADRDTSGRIVRAGKVDLQDLQAGDCLKALPDDGLTGQAARCDQPHAAEVFAAFGLRAGPYPGRGGGLERSADRGCEERAPAATHEGLRIGTLAIWHYVPNEAAWDGGDREVLCLVTAERGTLTKGYTTAA